jgi:hypothetical protein
VTQPAPLTQWTPELRNVAHPDLSQVLIHFCDRARPLGRDIPEEILGMSPPERLTSILWDGHLRVFVTDSGGDPVVCFTESTWRGLDYVIGERSRAPWGVIFERQSVYDAGGGPTWHARPEEHQALAAQPPAPVLGCSTGPRLGLAPTTGVAHPPRTRGSGGTLRVATGRVAGRRSAVDRSSLGALRLGRHRAAPVGKLLSSSALGPAAVLVGSAQCPAPAASTFVRT